jgi:hypothetical protein
MLRIQDDESKIVSNSTSISIFVTRRPKSAFCKEAALFASSRTVKIEIIVTKNVLFSSFKNFLDEPTTLTENRFCVSVFARKCNEWRMAKLQKNAADIDAPRII